MDSYFKLLRAHEEIDRLNVEVRRVATHLRDEDHYLRQCEETLRLTDPCLAHQISIHSMLRGRFKMHHARVLQEIAKLDGFTGTIAPGVSMDTSEGASIFSAATQPLPVPVLSHVDDEDTPSRTLEIMTERHELEQEAEEEEEEEALAHDIMDVLSISVDGMQLQA
jgi:hypothetical protein